MSLITELGRDEPNRISPQAGSNTPWLLGANRNFGKKAFIVFFLKWEILGKVKHGRTLVTFRILTCIL